MIRSRLLTVTVLAGVVALLGACGTSTESTATNAGSITVADGWVKAADSGMSAAFGDIKNSSDEPITITKASTPASSMVQLHETVTGSDGQTKMQEKEGGFVIPAKGSFKLQPGGNHIMFMDITEPIKAGDTIEITLTFKDGSTKTIKVAAKDFTGANESYSSSASPSASASSMSMG
jgi:periplasmic copper chaperone A